MAKIKILDEKLINKIAAGEVVENPKSIVKEMIENSLDAGATKITVEIKDGGKEYIRITDNGSGLDKDDLEVAFERHATSKIGDENDLECISTLGFRGEALSSISAVSKVELITKTKDDLTGSKIYLEGGNIIENTEVGCNVGTTFTVKELFYNVPARKKFLKKTKTESGYIYDLINVLALSREDVSFKLISNNTVILQTSGNKNLKHVMYQTFGKEVLNNIYEVDHNDKIKVKGYIADPIKNNRVLKKYGVFILNGRYIKSDLMYNAVKDAIGNRLMTGKHPMFVLKINIDPSEVDVNVHPNKLEVRFSDEKLIYDIVFDAVKNVFEDDSFMNLEKPKTFVEVTEKDTYEIEEVKTINDLIKNDSKGVSYDNVVQKSTVVQVAEKNYDNDITESKSDVLNKFYENKQKPSNEIQKATNNFIEEKIITPKNPTNYDNTTKVEKQKVYEKPVVVQKVDFKFIGQLFNTYCVIEKDSTVYLIDQHAAHEKVLYEKILSSLKKSNISSQILLQPLSVTLTELETECLKDNMDMFKSFGFDIQEFGKDTFAIRGVPLIFNNPVGVDFFNDILDLILHENKKIESIFDLKLDKIASMACKSAIKANKYLDVKEVKELINQMLTLENPSTCPHGRPTMIEITKKEIEKLFKRIV